MDVARTPFFVCVLTMTALVAGAPAQAANATTATQSAASEDEVTPTPSPWGWLTMPKITMPKITMPKMPDDPLAPVKTSAKKVSDGAKKAWEGTKEILTFGTGKSNAPATKTSTAKEPSLWQRMFGSEKKQEPQGPQTVAEWMAQPRLDP